MKYRPLLVIVLLGLLFSAVPATAQPSDTSHPRLWITADDLPRLREWATVDNPFYGEGLLPLAERATADMDAGYVPHEDTGGITWEQYPSEMYAMLFAFMSLIEDDAARRDDYAHRARTVLMYAMDQAVQGVAAEAPFRDIDFSTYDRSRWWGEGFALAVDWIYPYLTTADKTTIRQVFIRWIDENMNAAVTAFNHPEPAGIYNDPALLDNPEALRWSLNNYYLAHMRNIGLMALALDPDDDPDGALQSALQSAIGAWLYRSDYMLRTADLRGFSPEGWEYGPESLGSLAQFLLALETAGKNDPTTWGTQVTFAGNPFWQDVIPAFLHSLSPATTVPEEWSWIGEVYQPAWFGDGQHYWAPDFIGLFGPLGLHAYRNDDAQTLEAIRWIQTHTPPGGDDMLLARLYDTEVFRNAILYFLLFDPAAPPPSDPRPHQETIFYAPGAGRTLARTSWHEDASWFTFHSGWLTIDHQLGEGGQFEFYRQGEWLTSGRVGWDGTIEPYGCNIGRSDFHNTLAIENDRPDLEEDHFLMNCYRHGSQWLYVAAGDGQMLANSSGDDYLYVHSDLTALYNSHELGVNDVQHASRAIIWLQPDTIVVFDRIETLTDGRFKRFWLNTPTLASIVDNQAFAQTNGGQQLTVTTLLPEDAIVSAAPAEPLDDEVAIEQPMDYRILVEAPGGPSSVTFLHVLQGSDATPIRPTSLATNTDIVGAVIANTVVVFPETGNGALDEIAYQVTPAVTQHIITGLAPHMNFEVDMQPSNDGVHVSVRLGKGFISDEGGVLMIE